MFCQVFFGVFLLFVEKMEVFQKILDFSAKLFYYGGTHLMRRTQAADIISVQIIWFFTSADRG